MEENTKGSALSLDHSSNLKPDASANYEAQSLTSNQPQNQSEDLSTAHVLKRDAKPEAESNAVMGETSEKPGEVHGSSGGAATEKLVIEGTSNDELKDVSDSEKSGEVDAQNEKTDDEDGTMPIGPKLILITFSLMLAVFCVALDNTIIAVAIPKITDDFKNLNDIGWYASAYLLTSCAPSLLFGKFYARYSVKWVFLVAISIFELGSLVCGVAPNSTALILGRAIAGFGSAGIFTGALVTIAYTVPLQKRPAFFGLIGGMYGIASVAGPLVCL